MALPTVPLPRYGSLGGGFQVDHHDLGRTQLAADIEVWVVTAGTPEQSAVEVAVVP